MTFTIPEWGVFVMWAAFSVLGGVAFLAWKLPRIALEFARRDVDEFQSELAALKPAHERLKAEFAAERRTRESEARKILDIAGEIDRITEILGFSDEDDEDDEDEGAEKPKPDPPAPRDESRLYACTIASVFDDENHEDCIEATTTLLIRARSRDEAKGIAWRVGEKTYSDPVKVTVVDSVTDPEA